MQDGQALSTTDDVTTQVMALAKELLRDDELDVESNFLGSGGHSVLAVKFSHLVQRRYGVPIDLRVLFRGSLGDVCSDLVRRGASPSPAADNATEIEGARNAHR